LILALVHRGRFQQAVASAVGASLSWQTFAMLTISAAGAAEARCSRGGRVDLAKPLLSLEAMRHKPARFPEAIAVWVLAVCPRSHPPAAREPWVAQVWCAARVAESFAGSTRAMASAS